MGLAVSIARTKVLVRLAVYADELPADKQLAIPLI